MRTKYHILVIAVFIVSGFVGYNFGVSQGQKAAEAKFQSQLDRAKQYLPQLGEIHSLSAKVKEIKGREILIEAIPSSNPFAEWPVIREVTLMDSTKFIKRETKESDLFQKELETYQKTTQPSILPNPFTDREIIQQELRTGDSIIVEAGEDIKMLTKFKAIRIIVLAGEKL